MTQMMPNMWMMMMMMNLTMMKTMLTMNYFTQFKKIMMKYKSMNSKW